MTKRLTDAEKQARYRARQNERRNEDAGVATAGRSLCYWIERARERGVKDVTLRLGESGKFLDFAAEITRIEAAIAGAVIDAQEGKLRAKATEGKSAPSLAPASLSALDSTTGKRKPATRRKAVKSGV